MGLAAAAMEWSSESAAVRRHRGAAEHREGRAAAPRREAGASAPEDSKGDGRTRKERESPALSEARTVLALALYLLALRALVQLSLQRLLLSGTAGLQGEFDARQARYGRPAGPRVPCGPGPGSAGSGSPGSLRPRRSGAAVC